MSNFNDALYAALKELNKRTNGDRIRSMTDEELARFFCDEYGCPIGRGYPDCAETPTDPVCMGCWIDWLRQEAVPDA